MQYGGDFQLHTQLGRYWGRELASSTAMCPTKSAKCACSRLSPNFLPRCKSLDMWRSLMSVRYSQTLIVTKGLGETSWHIYYTIWFDSVWSWRRLWTSVRFFDIVHNRARFASRYFVALPMYWRLTLQVKKPRRPLSSPAVPFHPCLCELQPEIDNFLFIKGSFVYLYCLVI